VGVAVSDGCAALVEVNAETDFVVRNPKFQARAGVSRHGLRSTLDACRRSWCGARRQLRSRSTAARSGTPGARLLEENDWLGAALTLPNAQCG
jgi:hypothetical protein